MRAYRLFINRYSTDEHKKTESISDKDLSRKIDNDIVTLKESFYSEKEERVGNLLGEVLQTNCYYYATLKKWKRVEENITDLRVLYRTYRNRNIALYFAESLTCITLYYVARGKWERIYALYEEIKSIYQEFRLKKVRSTLNRYYTWLAIHEQLSTNGGTKFLNIVGKLWETSRKDRNAYIEDALIYNALYYRFVILLEQIGFIKYHVSKFDPKILLSDFQKLKGILRV